MNNEHLYRVLEMLTDCFKIPTKESCDLTMFYKTCPKYLKTILGFAK